LVKLRGQKSERGGQIHRGKKKEKGEGGMKKIKSGLLSDNGRKIWNNLQLVTSGWNMEETATLSRKGEYMSKNRDGEYTYIYIYIYPL
jgi:hypothetical protein